MQRLCLAALAGLLLALPAPAQERRNPFGDPFLQVMAAMPGCPVPRPPGFTPEEVRREAHVRAQHGTSCYRSGRCRLPNSYLYDQEIIPRVQQYLRLDGRFDDTSVWILGERRIVTLMGCVRTAAQKEEMERAVPLVDDVMGVVNWLMVGTGERAKYELAKP
ncbi:BON domain-containing protein [Ramlibacter sp. AN1133]|uniref:BON domain-containing protein n=1 Tax=Ramlibacter sp. AN1133 TaxID=3133429 RepID=UPI0030BEA15B